MARIENRFIVVDEPFYRIDGMTFSTADDYSPCPKVGDVVTIKDKSLDDDGDYTAVYKGGEIAIAPAAVASVEKIVAAYRSVEAAPKCCLGTADDACVRTAPKVSGDAPILSIDAVADELLASTGLDGPEIDLAIAYALLRTTGAL